MIQLMFGKRNGRREVKFHVQEDQQALLYLWPGIHGKIDASSTGYTGHEGGFGIVFLARVAIYRPIGMSWMGHGLCSLIKLHLYWKWDWLAVL
jgi:hypothetical protein